MSATPLLRSVTVTLHNLPFRAWERSADFTHHVNYKGEVRFTHILSKSVLFYLLHLVSIPCGKFRPPFLGKATAAARAALVYTQSYKCMLRVSPPFHNQPNRHGLQDLSRAHMLILTRAFTQGDCGHTDSENTRVLTMVDYRK